MSIQFSNNNTLYDNKNNNKIDSKSVKNKR